MERKNALIPGASGIIGRTLIEYLSNLDDWNIVGLSRRSPESKTEAKFIEVDLLDRADCEQKLGSLNDITHIFYAAYQPRPTFAEEVEPNKMMLVNVVETVEVASPSLQHVNLITGGKYYGAHLGSFKTPAKESDPRHMPPNFYYDQLDFLQQQQQGKAWAWSNLRPSHLCGFAIGNPMNLISVIGVYAAISKELSLPLRFPGLPNAYSALTQMVDTTLLAKAAVWAATNPKCSNESFNIANGDYIRWKHLWYKFAEFFGMEYAEPQTISLTEFMADKKLVWEAMVKKYDLYPYSYDKLVAWQFGDAVFRMDYDVILDTNKIRHFGFHEYVDSEEMFFNRFGELQRNKVIP
jgi:nucleoside-diphosphate-sugar epimerase